MSRQRVVEAWAAIGAALEARGEDPDRVLSPPANAADLAALEGAASVELTEEHLASVSEHDGQALHAPSLGRWDVLSLALALDQYRQCEAIVARGDWSSVDEGWVQAVGPVAAVDWNPRWVPFAVDATGTLAVVDYAPAEGGRVGQVVLVFRDAALREVVAGSVAAFLEQVLGELAQRGP